MCACGGRGRMEWPRLVCACAASMTERRQPPATDVQAAGQQLEHACVMTRGGAWLGGRAHRSVGACVRAHGECSLWPALLSVLGRREWSGNGRSCAYILVARLCLMRGQGQGGVDACSRSVHACVGDGEVVPHACRQACRQECVKLACVLSLLS